MNWEPNGERLRRWGYPRLSGSPRVLSGPEGLFPPQRIAQLQGEHPRIHQAQPGKRYAGLLDVVGEEEEGSGPEAFDNASWRDSTALTIVEVETGGEGCRSTASSIGWPGPG